MRVGKVVQTKTLFGIDNKGINLWDCGVLHMLVLHMLSHVSPELQHILELGAGNDKENLYGTECATWQLYRSVKKCNYMGRNLYSKCKGGP